MMGKNERTVWKMYAVCISAASAGPALSVSHSGAKSNKAVLEFTEISKIQAILAKDHRFREIMLQTGG
jgi:hypothetical protein